MSEIAESFASSLSELTVNSKPHINMLTMLAEDHLEYAPVITQTVLTHLQKVPPEIKLPVLYLIDSIVKNVGKAYIDLFTQNIVQCFTATFEKVDEKTREQMFKLRQTWSEVFPQKIIYALDAKVHQIDPAWPLSAPPSTVHLNPKFFKPDILESKSITSTIKQPELAHIESRSHHRKSKSYSSRNHNVTHSSRSKKATTTTTPGVATAADVAAPAVRAKPSPTPEQLREQMIMKQKMLLELQQQKLKLELLQTQAQLEEQQKQLERHSVNSKTSQELSKLQQLLKEEEEKLKLMSKNLKKHTQKFPNRQQIVRVTSDMKAHKVTDLSRVTSSAPESLVKPAALLELNKDDKPKAPSKAARPRAPPPLPAPVPEKQKMITPADSTEDVVPPVRIAPVSSQLINAALSFGRNVRDPRIRQMSSRLESQLNTAAPTHPPPPPPASEPSSANSSAAPDNKSFDRNRRDKKSSNNHRDRSSRHPEEESRSHSRSSSRGSDKSSTRSKERDKEKSSPKRSEEKISSSRRAKIEELFSNSNSRSKSPADTKTVSSTVTHSPSKPHSNREQNSRSDKSESSKPTHSEKAPKTESSPKRIKFQDLSLEKRNVDDHVHLEPLKDSQKLSVDINKAQSKKQVEIPLPSVSPEAMDTSAEMMDEDVEKIVKHPGFSKLKNKENKSDTLEIEKSESQDSTKFLEESIEDKFDDIIKHPSKQFKLNEEKLKSLSALFDSPVVEKKDETEPRKEILDANVPSLPLRNNKEMLKEENVAESFSSDRQTVTKIADGVPVRDPTQPAPINVGSDMQTLATSEQQRSQNVFEDSVIKNIGPSSKSSEHEVSSTMNSFSALQHDIHESYVQEEVVSTEIVAYEPDEFYVPMDSDEIVQKPDVPQEKPSLASHIPEKTKLDSVEITESTVTLKPADRLTLSPKKVMSPVRNVELMETIVEANENICSVGEVSSPKKSERKHDSSPVQQEKRSKKNDKPSLMEQVIADEERHEASPSPPPPPIISDKFKEIKQSSLSRLRRVGRSREDLTGQESPEPADVDLRTQIPPPPPSITTKDLKNEVLGLAEKDVDLRNLPASPKKRPSMEKLLDIPPAKKTKSEGMMDELFGSEDVDYRPVLCAPPPSPPPPPIISSSPPPDAAGERLWARYKQNKPDAFKAKYTPSRRDRAPSVDKFGRFSRLNSSGDGRWGGGGGGRLRNTEDVDMRAPPLTTDGSYNYILNQALEQHQRGDMDKDTYKKVVSEVSLMREKQQLEVAQRKDEEAQHEQLEPISDDDISAGSLSGVEDAPSPPESYSGGEDIDELSLKKSKTEEKPKVKDDHDAKAFESLKDVDIRVPPADIDIRPKTHLSYDKDEKPVDDKPKRKTRGASPYSRRSDSESEKEKYRRHRDEVRAQRKERKAKREEERGSRYRQPRYGQEAWVPPPELSGGEEMDVDPAAPPRVPPLPPYLHAPQLDSPPHGPASRPPHWDPQRVPPGPTGAPAPGPWPPGIPPGPPGPGMPPNIRGPPVMGLRPPQDRFMPPRWHQPGPGPIFDGEPGPGARFSRFGPPPMGRFHPPLLGPGEVPPTDQAVLKAIEEDPTRSINIDGIPRDIRFYGITAVALMSWDDPREISFQPGSRRVILDERDSVVVHFGGPPVEMIIDGQPRRLRFGAPTRELFIDNQWFEVFFGGPPVACNIAGQPHMVQLEGPPPPVKPGVPRRDLVLGKITLIIDAEYFFTIFLDAKPQKFEVKGIGYIIRFVEALQKTVINGVPFKSDFGGLPRPIILNGTKHFFRLTALPRGVTPGFLSIANMEGGRLPSPPSLPAPPQLPASLEQAVLVPPQVPAPPRISPELRDRDRDVEPGTLRVSAAATAAALSAPLVTTQPPASVAAATSAAPVIAPTPVNPLDMLTTLLPTTEQGRPNTDYSYTVDNESSNQAQDGASAPAASAGEINVSELLQKLMATGIVPSLEQPKDKAQDSHKPHTTDAAIIKPVDFRKPETLKTRQTMLISQLYSGIQCNSCGVRFPPEQTMKYSQHLDWHFRQNRRDKDSSRTAQTRRYYYDVSDWIQFEEIEDLEERAQPWFEMQDGAGEEEEPERVVVSVRAADYPDDASCNICHDKFESFYDEEKEEWHLRNASDHEGKLVHPICLEDQKAAAEKPIVVDDIDITEDEPKEDEQKKEEEDKEKKAEEPPKEEEDDDIMEVMDIEYIKPVFPVEDLTVSDNEEEKEEREKEKTEEETKEEKKAEEELSEEVTSTTNEIEEPPKDETMDEGKQDEEESKSDEPTTEPERVAAAEDEDTADDVLLMDKGEDSALSAAEIMEVVRNIKKDPDALGGEYEESGLDPEVKKEKGEIPLPAPVVDTTHATVTCLIDGNVEFEEPAQIVATGPPKIKINISKAIQPAPKEKEVSKEDEATEPLPEMDIPNPLASALALNYQPPPPGEEPLPVRVKERIKSRKMVELPMVMKDKEMSGLCSIM